MGPSVTASATSNYVTVGVGDEIFGVDVANVREILAYRTVVHLPNAPPFLVGVIDVRGCTVPVSALHLKLGLPAASIIDDTRILVLEIDVEDRPLVVSLLADRVFEVAEFEIDGLVAAADNRPALTLSTPANAFHAQAGPPHGQPLQPVCGHALR